MSAFIRKMVLNGYMIIPEWPELKGVLSLHSRISNNLNQYAKKANETGNIYREDIAELKEMQLQFLPVFCLEDIFFVIISDRRIWQRFFKKQCCWNASILHGLQRQRE